MYSLELQHSRPFSLQAIIGIQSFPVKMLMNLMINSGVSLKARMMIASHLVSQKEQKYPQS